MMRSAAACPSLAHTYHICVQRPAHEPTAALHDWPCAGGSAAVALHYRCARRCMRMPRAAPLSCLCGCALSLQLQVLQLQMVRERSEANERAASAFRPPAS